MESTAWVNPGAGLKDLKAIRQFVEKRLFAFGVAPDIIYDLLLAITEAVTNILLHGYGGQPGWLKVEIEQKENDIRLITSDRAPAFDPTQVPEPDLSVQLEERLVGGMGVHLIRQNVDQVHYSAFQEGGNELILIKENAIVRSQRRMGMEITIEQVAGNLPVTILGLHGELDASNFETVINKVNELYQSGSRYMLVDMSGVNFMSSSGLVALHSMALILRGEQPHDLEGGWSVFDAIDQDRNSGLQKRIKLLNPQPKVNQTLAKTGMDRFFEVHTDRTTAIHSF
jgi:serine/threonine-protein kinase RsbW